MVSGNPTPFAIALDYAVVLAGFGAFALAIAGVGLFGVLSYSVAQRTREIGVRTALGARPADIVALVVRQAAVVATCGIAGGVWAITAEQAERTTKTISVKRDFFINTSGVFRNVE